MWKGEVSQVCKRCPRCTKHIEISSVTWLDDGVLWIAELLSKPFGFAGSVHAFHGVASVPVACFKQIFYVLASKCTDVLHGMS